jgi:gamma-glutamyltranspeptidase / glutathione hydrolase
MRLRRLLPVLAALLLAVAVAATAGSAAAKQGSAFRPAVSGKLGVVATEAPAAARVGRRVLERGGNAVDAAVATVFAIGVVRPQSCGLGGGGFMVYRSHTGRTATLDFREQAPAAFTPETLQGEGLHEEFTGHLTVGVPGTVAGMDAALKRFGTLSLSRAIAPAVRLAST